MVSTNKFIYTFICYPYKALEEKKVVTEFVEREVLVSVPEMFYPYSLMLLDRLVYFKWNYGSYNDPVEYSFYAGMQSTVIAVSNLSAFTAEEKEVFPTYDIGWGGPDFQSKEYDLKAYVEEIFKLSEAEFRETYAEYPIIIDKMEEMVKVLHKHGVKVYE